MGILVSPIVWHVSRGGKEVPLCVCVSRVWYHVCGITCVVSRYNMPFMASNGILFVDW